MSSKYKQVKLSIPVDVYKETMDNLYSEVEQGVPYGAWSRLIVNLLRVWIRNRQEHFKVEPDLPEYDDEQESPI